ncbi:MAG: rhodanese-like domain-containing protein [Thiothrix sp.]|nr:rhodanese-like domain-containing protein [Thiothrix sp.]HPE62316.1 rhodanese-like domain-containing protein [Thiolinea sp.]
MSAQTYQMLVAGVLPQIRELFPWDLEQKLRDEPETLVVDIREAGEFAQGAIAGALHVPRGILEGACDWGYSETVPVLVQARMSPVVLVCRSGNRSALAAHTLQLMGYQAVWSLKTGVRGWNDYELPLFDAQGQQVDIDEAEARLSPPVTPEQQG